jgi:hypothetical protein
MWTSNEQEGKAGGRKARASPPAEFLERFPAGFDLLLLVYKIRLVLVFRILVADRGAYVEDALHLA